MAIRDMNEGNIKNGYVEDQGNIEIDMFMLYRTIG